VFDAWADETQFIQWMCPPGVMLDEASLDVRPGGAWRVRGHRPDRTFATSGRYLEVKRPERLVFTWAHHASADFDAPRGHETTVRLEFRSIGNKTELTLIHGSFADAPNRRLTTTAGAVRSTSSKAFCGGQHDNHRIVSQSEWLEASRAQLAKEKEFTRLREELARQRRELPWVKVEKNYVFEAPEGRVSLGDLFAGRGQLIVQHFMFGPTGTRAARAAPSGRTISTASTCTWRIATRRSRSCRAGRSTSSRPIASAWAGACAGCRR
jgi:uncharacterized protein YndB with AHSA1/START domain